MYDFIIVGQGLAGSALAFTLIRRGCQVQVINVSSAGIASQVAAGLYNPVTGRKMVRTWKADELFPFLENFYTDIESETESKFLHKKNIYRPFISIEEQNDWMGKSSNNQFTPFVQHVAQHSLFGSDVYDSYGGLLLKRCGYLDIPAFIYQIRKLLLARNMYREEKFNFQKLKIEDNSINYNGLRARNMIFCEGPAGNQNPFFEWLPFQPVKGELLYIVPEKPLNIIYNRGVFVLPADGYCKVGATYNHHDLSLQITTRAREYLLEKLNMLLKARYKVIDQVAGVRPATRDRRPFMGIHPKYKPLAIFNGLGTKGVSLAPFFASQLADSLLDGKPLEREVNISRFYQFYNSAIT